jgi:hypothetical protein
MAFDEVGQATDEQRVRKDFLSFENSAMIILNFISES